MEETADAGEQLVAHVEAAVGVLSADEHAAVYGAGYSFAASSSTPPQPNSIGWIATIVHDFRSGNCVYCGHGLLEHTLALHESGPAVICDEDSTSRPAWRWHAGPEPTPLWRTLLAVLLWVGLPLVSIGLASWVMPLVAAVGHRRRRWVIAAAVWAALTITLVIFIERDAEGPLLGLLALTIWFGSALYGAFQVKPWLQAGRRR